MRRSRLFRPGNLDGMTKQHILNESRGLLSANGRWAGTGFSKRRASSRPIGKENIGYDGATQFARRVLRQMKCLRRDDGLLDKLVALVRELRHFPVKAEFRLKARSDPSFPNQKTFSRFGSKTQIAACVADYCRARAGYDDVFAACDAIRPVKRRNEIRVIWETPETFGFVYLFKSGRHFKLGRSNSVGRREYELKLQLPENQ